MSGEKGKLDLGLTLCLTLLFISVGCTNNRTDQAAHATPGPISRSYGMLVVNDARFSDTRVYRDKNGLVWVPLEETMKSVGLDVHDVGGSLAIGHTDPAYSVKDNQTEAYIGDNAVELPDAPTFFDRKLCMTTRSLSILLGTPVNWNAQNSQLVIAPIDHKSLAGQSDLSVSPPPGSDAAGTMHGLAAATVNKNELLSFAKQYMGTPYQFAAGPYERTSAFDCSSFVQYVYAHHGVKLPRSSRSQAKVGQPLDINQLQPGDLMFFTSPTRFGSSGTVGHVGIYAGNGQIVHTYGKPGVTVTAFKGNWKTRFLFGKRVA